MRAVGRQADERRRRHPGPGEDDDPHAVPCGVRVDARRPLRQLADDVLDVASDSADSGKTPGTDLREGVPTLPVLHALASKDPADARLRALLSEPLTDDALHAEALTLLRAHHAMELARLDARRWAAQARALLDPLPDIPAKSALTALCDAVVSRTG